MVYGFKNLKKGWDYYPAYQEAQTRQISDWLVGMNGSQLYTLLLQQAGVKGGLKSIFETDFKRHSEPRLPSTARINH